MQPARQNPVSPYQLCLRDGGDSELLGFVRQQFARHHGAQIDSLMPWQCALRDGKDQLVASVGLRSAAVGPLFLEHYLPQPVEQQLAQVLQRPVARDEILEVGNPAAASGHARLLFVAMANYLSGERFRYVVFTATDRVQEIVTQLGLPALFLAEAKAELVPVPDRWGNYYQRSPQVLAGEIRSGWEYLKGHPAMQPQLAWLPALPTSLPQEVHG